MADKEYGVIHEIGDYFKPQKLNEEDNKAVNEQVKEEKKRREQNNK